MEIRIEEGCIRIIYDEEADKDKKEMFNMLTGCHFFGHHYKTCNEFIITPFHRARDFEREKYND